MLMSICAVALCVAVTGFCVLPGAVVGSAWLPPLHAARLTATAAATAVAVNLDLRPVMNTP
jgi:hypothetical protein